MSGSDTPTAETTKSDAEERARQQDAQRFALEHWRTYETYIERKERVVEVATTVYLAFATTVMSQKHGFWLDYKPASCPMVGLLAILALGVVTAAMVLRFVHVQMGYRREGARISEASQTMMTRWLHHSPQWKDLEPEKLVGEFSGVELPKGLAEELRRQPRRRLDAFECTVYGLIIAWTLALGVRLMSVWR